MVKKQAHFLVLTFLLAALPATSQAQDLNIVLNNVTKAMGSAILKTIRFSGSGSTYADGKYVAYLKSYTRDIDLNTPATRVQMVREEGKPPADQQESWNIAGDAPWTKQFELWTSPWEFLKAAATNKAAVSTETIAAQKFTVVTFMVQNEYKIRGYIDDQNMIEKIQAWVDPDNTPMEMTYRSYQDFNGVKFPMMIIEKQAGELAMLVLVNNVQLNAPLN
jgi:hypothetical protein